MKKLLMLTCLSVTILHFSYAQQWTGATYSASPGGNAWRNGNIGINNQSPNFLIDIIANASYQGIQLFQSNGKWVRFYTPSLAVQGYNNITAANDAGIVFGNIAGLNTVDHGFVIVPHRSTSSGIRITPTGTVGIGTSLANNPNGYMLAVNGKIGAKEVQVENTSSTWADYVFEKNYSLMPLADVESFIKSNKHLPEIPSAEEIKENGHKLGEMDVLLLKKIEELTLYILDQQKDIANQDNRIKELEATILELKTKK